MGEYFIGAGALLTTGPPASIVSAALHAQIELRLEDGVNAALIDFESTRLSDVSRVLIVATGWSTGRFRAEVVQRLLARRDCALPDVVAALGDATGAKEVHLFARWASHPLAESLGRESGARVAAYPLEAIGRAALICGQRIERWPSPGRAA